MDPLWGVIPVCGLDTLTVAAGLGAAGTPGRARAVLTLAAWEGGMPLLGAVVGHWLSWLAAAQALRWGAAALLVFLGLRAVREGWREAREVEEGPAPAPPQAGLWLAGMSASVDELGLGLALGVGGVRLALVAAALALQAALGASLGLWAGAALRRWAGRYGELAGGLALLAVAAALLLGRA